MPIPHISLSSKTFSLPNGFSNFNPMRCNRLVESMSIIPAQEINRVNYSELSDWEAQNYSAATYSIKYVLEGTEHYKIDNKLRAVSAGQFLVVNNDRPVHAFIKSRKKVKGFCFHLKTELLQDISHVNGSTHEKLIDDPFNKGAAPMFDELIYGDHENELGFYLQKLKKCFDPNSAEINVDREEIFERLGHHFLKLKSTTGIASHLKVIRNSTKTELIRRLDLAKQMIDQDISAELNVAMIARTAMLSPSYFLASFKKVYGISPYQYLIRRRLQTAKSLLGGTYTDIQSVAHSCGFADGAAFSKAFKKEFGIGPSRVSSFRLE
jgi:AraC family transcriptional regulator